MNQEASFSCLGGINRDKVSSYDDGQESSIAYQWYLDGSALSDGTVQRQTASMNYKNFIGNHVVTPDDAQDVEIRIVGGAGGSGGNDSGSSGWWRCDKEE